MGATADSFGTPRDDQQRRVIERLREAHGEPVDFEELLAIGIEHPAVVCYELELSGVPIVQRRESNRLLFSLPVRRTAPAAAHEPGRGQPRRPRRPVAPHRPPVPERSERAEEIERPRRGVPRGGAVRARVLASQRSARLALPAGALALIAVGAALLVSASGDHPHGTGGARLGSTRTHAHARPGTPPRRAPAQAAAPVELAGVPVPGGLRGRTPPVPVSPGAAAALESEGHRLLAAGQYSAAVDRLLGAIRASGQSLAQCMEPGTEACLTFAYALYDLGRALRLDGDPSAAIPVLRQRLRIDNQRPIVQQELELARNAGA
jgi:hypothetical protein